MESENWGPKTLVDREYARIVEDQNGRAVNESLSRYGTLAVAIMFGMVYGVVSLTMGRILMGIFMLGLTVFTIALVVAPDSSAKLLVGTSAAVICSGALAYFAVSSEITGEATYYRTQGRRFIAEPVTRSAAPSRFRRANNFKWGLSLLCAGAATATFMSCRKLDDSDFP